MKDAVRLYDPVNNQPEKIVVTKELKASVRSPYAVYKAKLEEEKSQKRKQEEEARQKREVVKHLKREKEEIMMKKRSQ